MLDGREGNYTGRGRFCSADRCHLMNKYLPVKGPSIIDQLTTRAYVSQFSNDGALFVAAFQGSHIKIYNVEKGWKLQKNIVAKSLRWTVTDTSLSPDKRSLVYATMSPIVNIVNIGSTATESHANVTDIASTVQKKQEIEAQNLELKAKKCRFEEGVALQAFKIDPS